jgi:ferredoxin
MKIVIDRGRCIAASNCIGAAPAVFRLDGQRKAVVDNAAGGSDEAIMDAASSCPTEAISLFDETTGQQLFP